MPPDTPPTGKMTRPQFSAFIKKNIPELADIPDDQLVEGVLKNRPDLKDRIIEPGEFTKGFSESLGFSRPDIGFSQMAKETWENLKKGAGSEYQRLQEMTGEKGKPLSQRGFSEALFVPGMIASGIEGMAGGLEQAGKEMFTPGQFKQGAGRMLGSVGQLAMGMEGAPVAEGLAKKGLATAKAMPKELIGHGPTMDRLVAAKDLNALNIKEKVLAPLQKAAHDDAQNTISTAVKRMEERTPAAAKKTGLADEIDKIWGDVIKTPEKVPAPIQKLLAVEKLEGVPGGQLSKSELQTARLAADWLKEGLRPKEVRSMVENLGYLPKRIDAIMAIANPQADTGFWGVRELQQIRSDLGRSVFGRAGRSLDGPVRAVSALVYKLLSENLDSIAEKSNAQAAWRVGNEKWKLYNQTFDGKWEGGEFHDSPLADALRGQTADEIMNALGKGKLQWTRDLLGRYKQFGPNATALINKALNRHNWLDFVREMSHASKYDVIGAGAAALAAPHFLGELAAARVLTPPVLRWLATRGIKPENVRALQEIQPGVPEQ